MHEALPFMTLDEATMALQAMSRNRSNQPLPDNAATNPYYRPCPSARHQERRQTQYGQAHQALYMRAAEERMEWREVFGIPDLPVQWLGCSPGCLDFAQEWDVDAW